MQGARRMILGNVECAEIVEVILDLGAHRNIKTGARKEGLDA
jgi:hypothetical protein